MRLLLPVLLGLLVTVGEAAPKVYTGQFRYLADAGLFEDCVSGDRWPVAQQAANAELERIYLEKQKAGEPLWVKVEGELKHRLDLVAGKRRTVFVVTKVLDSAVRKCDALPKVPLEGTHWVLVELQGRRVPSGKRRDAYLVLQPSTGKAAGFSGCNHFMAPYTLEGDRLSFGPAGSTRMHCESGYELETAYQSMLPKAVGWKQRGKLLDLFDESGNRIARFATGNP